MSRQDDGNRAFPLSVLVFLIISAGCARQVPPVSAEKDVLPQESSDKPRGIGRAPAVSAEKDGVPGDFKIVAHYYPGYSHWHPWETTITSDGSVSQEDLFGNGKSQKMPSLAHRDVRDLLEQVKAANFFEIPKKFSYSVTDNPTLVLIVTMNNKTHEVSVYAPRHVADEPGVKKFMKLWSSVLEKVPSPNPEQKPEKPDGAPRGETTTGM